MKIDILVATIKQNDLSIASKMNINGNCIIANQANNVRLNSKSSVKMVTTNTKGVGINRNLGIMLSTADICVLADDDMVFKDDAMEVVQKAFKKIPEADIIIFNIDDSTGAKHRTNSKVKRLRFYNIFNYGAARVAFRRKSILKANIMFTLLFGGGCQYSNGEDSIFLGDAIKKGLKVYTYPESIATLQPSSSTWFRGYEKKFFLDKGAMYYCISNKLWRLLCLQDSVRHSNLYKHNWYHTYSWMCKGAHSFQERRLR